MIDRLVHTKEHVPNDTFIEVDAEKGKVREQHVRRNENLSYILIRQ
ncbi:MAG: hypothetical protein H0U54_09590 [Acidobacteria bacterium]|nr:hypothetical protein [Acidobacteriota bacterium]